MSIPVELEQLAATMGQYGFAYLMTVSDDGRPHAVAVSPTWSAEGVLMVSGGRRTTSNAAARPAVSLVWPPVEAGGYSLIVDAAASVGPDGVLALAPSTAVQHRPAPSGSGSDCAPVPLQ
jgi:Pyridoxamine 5'-phosphate oxidase